MSVKKEVASHLSRSRMGIMEAFGWSITRKVDECRFVVWEKILRKTGKAPSMTKVCFHLIKQLNLLPLEEGYEVTPARERLTLDVGERPEHFTDCVGRYHCGEDDPEGQAIHAPSDPKCIAAGMLREVVWVQDEQITEWQLDIWDDLTMEQRQKVMPGRTIAELNLIGSDPFQVDYGPGDTNDRIYARTAGVIAPMWSQWDRWRCVVQEWRTTDLKKHEAYLARECKVDTQAQISEILADPKAAFHAGVSMKAIVQCLSWHRIATTGKTNIPVVYDAVASGYAHQLAARRDEELFDRAFPFEKQFIHPHKTLAQGLRVNTPALATFTVSSIIPLAKFVFTPSMYGAGGTGLFSSATGKREIFDLCGEDGWKEVNLPPLLGSLIGDLKEEEKAHLLMAQCEAWSSIFHRKLPKVAKFTDWWMKRWTNDRSPEGLYIPRPDGSMLLVPHIKRNRYDTTDYRSHWWEGGDKIEDSVSLFDVRFDDEGTAMSAAFCQGRDAFTAAWTVIYAGGKVLASIHDAFMFMLADEDVVQRSYTRAFSLTHDMDAMETGKQALVIDESRKMLR